MITNIKLILSLSKLDLILHKIYDFMQINKKPSPNKLFKEKMKLITNYLRKFHILKKIYRYVRKGPFQNSKELIWFISQNLKMMTLKRKKPVEIDEMLINLSNKNYSDGSVIVITFGSRWVGNPDNQLSVLMDSYLANTRVPSRVELLIKIDDDDYLTYFAEIK